MPSESDEFDTCRGYYDEDIDMWLCPRDHCEQCPGRGWLGRTHDEIMQLEEYDDE